MLSHLRVLDLTDGGASIAGRILADLGAEVILVEAPSGAASRALGPFVDDDPHPDRSLEFFSRHRGKRSIVLDLEAADDRDRLRSLLPSIDIWIDDAPVGRFAALGLTYDALASIHPSLVHAAITPFGEVGPKSAWAATDLTVTAASTAMSLTGDADRAPLSCSVPQAFLHAGAEAAASILIALRERDRSGLGQHIDVSAQTAMMATCQSNVLAHGWNDRSLTRSGGGVQIGRYRLRMIYECLDGFVNLTFLFGEPIGHATKRFFDWMDAEGFSNNVLRAEDWVRYGAKVVYGKTPVEAHEAVMEAIERFTRTKTKAELFAAAFERHLLLVPLSDTRDLLESKQLAAREFFRPVKDPALAREILCPGPFARFSATPLDPSQPPPRLGDANAASFGGHATHPSSPSPTRGQRERPLAGLKVLDFTWVYAGPAMTRQLADYGATVVKIESTTAHDALRASGPYPDGRGDAGWSANFANVNLGKLSLGLNMKIPEARAVALRLVDWADVVIENFSPRAMKSLGFDYESLRAHKPDLLMLSSSLTGGTGPESSLAGYGTMGSALAGFGFLTGWPGQRPCAPYMAYTDYVAPRFAMAALMAALAHRDRTGVGQHIDLSQAECSIHFLGAAILDYAANDRIAVARGNELAHYAPSGVYPTRGEDRWIAIAAPDDAAWQSLAQTADQGWQDDPRFRDDAARRNHREHLDKKIAAWSVDQDRDALEVRLQRAGVPSHRVSTSRDAFEDPQLAARGHFVPIEIPEIGSLPFENARARFSATPAVPGPCPSLGQHNAPVLSEILGLSDDEITDLVIAGAVE